MRYFATHNFNHPPEKRVPIRDSPRSEFFSVSPRNAILFSEASSALPTIGMRVGFVFELMAGIGVFRDLDFLPEFFHLPFELVNVIRRDAAVPRAKSPENGRVDLFPFLGIGGEVAVVDDVSGEIRLK